MVIAVYPGTFDPLTNGHLDVIRQGAALFDRVLQHVHYMVDVHTPTTGGRYAPFAFLPPTRCGASS